MLKLTFHGHTTTEHGSYCEVATVAGIAGSHHVLGIEHLLGELGHGQGPILLAPPGGERGETRHEEMQTWEGHHVNRQLPEISVQLARESEAGGDTRHGGRHQVVEISVGWGGQLEGTEADIVQSLVVDTVSLVCVLHELVDRQSGVVGLHNSIGYLQQ